jgi:hypothetical protein
VSQRKKTILEPNNNIVISQYLDKQKNQLNFKLSHQFTSRRYNHVTIVTASIRKPKIGVSELSHY